MAVTGDFSRLMQFSDRMARLSDGAVYRDVLSQLANETHKLIIAGFIAETDPYGRKWKPRKKPAAWAALAFGHIDNGHKLLDDTGKGINSVRVKVAGDGIAITSVDYMNYHLTGTGKMPARVWAIKKAGSLGPIWGKVYTRVYSAVLKAQLGLS